MRMSSLGAAMMLQAKGLETIMQANCRDRNRLALQADLLAANGCGVANVMAVTGEEPSYGDHAKARAVYDIDVIELLHAIEGLQKGRDMAGVELQGAPQFLVGATVNCTAKAMALEEELQLLQRKLDAGARFFVSPPLFDLEAIDPFLQKVDRRQVTLIPTVLLLKSVGMARYIDRNLVNVHVPKTLITRLQKAPDKVRECIRVAAEMVNTLQREGFAGVLLATLGWEDKLPRILEKL
jgi:5,10-methylenetetrahydrofolate reductase